MKTRIELSKSNRARCRICRETIALGEPRIVEGILSEDNEHVTPGYHHVACMAELNSVRALNVVAEIEADDLFEAALARIADADLVAQIRDRRAKIAGTRPLDDDAQAQALFAELEANPGDRGLLTVLADHLQQQGHERGELIMHDLAGSLDAAALERRRVLTSALAPPLSPGTRFGWGIGFVRKLELGYGVMADQLQAMFAHPSCRLLEVIVLNRYDGRALPVLTRKMLPRSLRRIELWADLAMGSDFSGLDFLKEVVLERASEASLDALEACGKRIPRLTIRTYELRAQHRPRLEALCEHLEFNDGTVEETPVVVERVEHATLGIGTVVRVIDDKIEVEFPGAGRKVFKRGAPFLRQVS